ncbi:hypothetical protein HPP92_023187 [Vanilla planifolia]|uniref:V-SNARE coiled-coil homology domain-containing protein n=1 Tax=Vanilla planifolia TaxID=51239 RepID=A0A835UEI5_VANPL|nr:hypothetical protein HPP92_023187 [Vanilla planifolia]
MGQQSLIYSFVARGTVILAEYTEFTGNFTNIASQCLQKLPASNNKFTIKEDFTKRYGGGKAATTTAKTLNREFGSKLKEHMQYCVDHPEEISKLAKVKAQVLDRGEKIELLVDKTENLRSQAQDFRQQGTKLRRKMWLQNMKVKLIVLAIIIALILIIVLSVCHGFKMLVWIGI